MNRAGLAQTAMREATRFRAQHHVGSADSVCPYDLALGAGLTVQFLSAPTLEGMYDKERCAIMLGSARPAGRRRFTCGHELGHHVFDHGTSLDQLRGPHTDAVTPEEFLADCFAAALLMPKTAIDSAINRRGWGRREFTDQMLWVLAQDLGVGYDALVTHLNLVVGYLSSAQTAKLQKKKPADLRDAFAGFEIEHDLYPVDEHWGARPVDLETGDAVIGPCSIVTGVSVEAVEAPRPHFLATRPGVTKIALESGRSIDVRVSTRTFSGRAQFRHEEEVEE